MSISQDDAERLLAAGFLEFEIDELSNAKSANGMPQPPINLDGAAWQSVMDSRLDWINMLSQRGWTPDEIK